MSTSTHIGSRIRAPMAAILLLNVIVLGIIAVFLSVSHQRYQDKAASDAEAVSRILEKDLTRFLSAVDLLLLATIDEIARQELGGGIDRGALEKFLARQDARLPEIIGLRVANEAGKVEFAVSNVVNRNVDVSDRSFFAYHRDSQDMGVLVTGPIVGRVTPERVVVFSRRRNHPDGAFAGTVHVAIAIDTFREAFSSVDLGPLGNVGLWDRSPTLLARFSHVDAPTNGISTPSPTLRELIRSNAVSAAYQAVSGVDGIPRQFVYRKVGAWPLYLVVGIAERDFLLQWWREFVYVGGLGGLFLVASGIAALAIRRALLVAEEARAVAEGARRQSDLILTSAGEGICGIDSKGRVSFINPAARRMLGWSDDDPCGEGLHAATHHHHADGSDYPVEECPIRQVLVGSIGAGPVHVEDEVYWRRDGSCFPVEYTATAITGSDGKVVGAVNIFRDITERRRTEQEIRDLALRQRAILANTPIGIAIIALDRRMLEANDAFCAIYGRPGEDVIGQSARILYADQDQFDDVGRRAYPLLREGKTFSGDVHMVRRDGSEVWVRLVSHLIDETVPDLGVVWAAEDITERKLLELDLMRSNAELERFAYVASHDLRQPLRMISSYLRLIQRRLGPQLDGEIAEFLGFAVNGARRMDRMIIDLLDYARIGRDTAPPEEVPLATVLAGAIANLEVAIAESGALVTAPPELPVVPGYPSELERLFQNLIGNALKFRAPERAPKVELSCRETARDWVIAVADNGIGIAPEDHARLFMVFQRLVSVEQYEGTGIGLAACRKIVEHHGGRIWVESALGEGCTFLVSLPKRVEPAKEIGIP